MKEIILLNFGNFSNYVSTHFWNLNVYIINKEHFYKLIYLKSQKRMKYSK